ncbi:hypothetical protein, partial [Dolichospermum planctonicum]|uniref:hypothetical protein n=1 Tax=Dolichospermum planctonicum TaxID=136072 RepID=UPI001F1FEEB0
WGGHPVRPKIQENQNLVGWTSCPPKNPGKSKSCGVDILSAQKFRKIKILWGGHPVRPKIQENQNLVGWTGRARCPSHKTNKIIFSRPSHKTNKIIFSRSHILYGN